MHQKSMRLQASGYGTYLNLYLSKFFALTTFDNILQSTNFECPTIDVLVLLVLDDRINNFINRSLINCKNYQKLDET